MAITNSSTSESTGKKNSEFAKLMRRFNGGGWFSFCIDFCYVLTHEEALFVQRLINLYGMAHEGDVDEDNYFRCTVSYLNYPPLKWTADEQRYLIDKLTSKEKPYLKKKVVGNEPPQRWIKVDVEKLHEDIEAELNKRGPTHRKRWDRK